MYIYVCVRAYVYCVIHVNISFFIFQVFLKLDPVIPKDFLFETSSERNDNNEKHC